MCVIQGSLIWRGPERPDDLFDKECCGFQSIEQSLKTDLVRVKHFKVGAKHFHFFGILKLAS